LTTLAGDPGGTPVGVEVERIGGDVLVVTLKPVDGEDFPQRHVPGGHAVLSLKDEMGWVSRPYTIISPPEAVDRRVLVVRCLAGGRMGRVLAGCSGNKTARIGTPSGDAFVRLKRRRSTVFLVAGVGLTPALAALRAEEGPRVTFVHATFRDKEPGLERLLADACAQSNVPVIMRDCKVVGRPTASDFTALARKHPGVDWFICGPLGYADVVRLGLRAAGVSSARVHAELFVASASSDTPSIVRIRTHAESNWAKTGLYLAAAWCIWALLPSYDVWSEWQSSDAWRTITGLVLISLIAWQWCFPFLCARGGGVKARRLELWHRAIGALSPIALLLHQRDLAHGLLCSLSILFVANTVVGSFDKTCVSDGSHRERFMQFWLPTHVVISCLITALSIWHVIMVVTYRGGAS
jgi:ferredoxin-NADP reductase